MYFGVFSFGFVACTTILGQQLESHTPFGPIITDTSRANNILPPAAGFLSSILIVNIPHVLLSFWYTFYNSIITRIEMAAEWHKFSDGYYPLRVTRPKGHQVSTYRLQLRYKYSIPLIVPTINLKRLCWGAMQRIQVAFLMMP
ncbi:hypothetical protein CGGC5_v006303 [Colletotrichum fructicola Nara gc5]|uniref:Uncharacterized protein n=1 Tax=Colletotrichum fructicola (strain Nara gc5) TaxID=1213859 RepID=A0A7J6J9B9_COLFN|nr:hypothetical protein CGGC5_v006303 [Colletotrichum fructicola Nara gc5]